MPQQPEDLPPLRHLDLWMQDTVNAINPHLKVQPQKREQCKPAPRCHRVTRRVGRQQAAMGLSLQDSTVAGPIYVTQWIPVS